MIPVTQTILSDPANGVRGNCLAAITASLLEIDIGDIPDLLEANDGWQAAWTRFCKSRGYEVRYCGDDENFPAGLSVAYGPGPRGTYHVAIYLDGELHHDPHPSRDGLLEVIGVFQVIKADVAQAAP
jgi:hypothetical protein